MATCTKCGTKNEEDAKFCVNCGARMEITRERHGDSCFEPERRVERECFGLPYGGAIIGIIIGLLIIISGLSMIFELDLGRYAGAFFVIIIGLLIVIGAIYGILRRRR
ncbi:zinc ribbon domain-containing protein [Candidatus Bathyarchaeota archaeon]|nr:zinc ribbon domain-containing protein [Candidatus Bathyarchaeota archaeon]